MLDGKVVEYGAAESVFLDPQHDYTKALFATAPGRGSALGLDPVSMG